MVVRGTDPNPQGNWRGLGISARMGKRSLLFSSSSQWQRLVWFSKLRQEHTTSRHQRGQPKVAGFAFTTMHPQLGAVMTDGGYPALPSLISRGSSRVPI